MKNKEKLYHYVFLLFCFSIPFEHLAKAIPNILLALLLVLFPFRNLKQFIKPLKKEFSAILLFIAIILGNTLLFQRWEDFNIALRLFSIPFILILSLPLKSIKHSLNAFIAGVFFLLTLSSFLIGIFFLNNHNFTLANGAEVNNLLLGHRPYLGFMYLMATFFSFYLATQSKNKRHRILYIVVGICFITYIYLVAARLSALSLLFSLLVALVYYVNKLKYYKKGLFAISLFLIVLFCGFSKNLAKRFYVNDDRIDFILAEPRYYIWDCAYKIRPTNSQEIIFGKGYKQTENELTACYRQKDNFLDADHKKWFIDSKFNTHNQFLDLYLSQGIIVLLLSLSYSIYLIILTRKKFFSLNLIFAFLLFLLVENVLIRQLGCMLFAILLCFVFRPIIFKFNSEISTKKIKKSSVFKYYFSTV